MWSNVSVIILGSSVLVSGPLILLGLAAVFAIGLTIAKIKLHVQQDPRIGQVDEALPGANCGGCGYPGCSPYAKAVVEGKAPVTACTVGGSQLAQTIADLLGVTFEVEVQTRPVIHCCAFTHHRKKKTPYKGVGRCSEANLVTGFQGCTYGCMGFGDCREVCKFGAIRMEQGLTVFDYAKCTSCGACVGACPRNLIEMIPFVNESMLVVACANRDPARVVREVCEVGCLGCGLCSRKSGAFGIDRNLACLQYDKLEDPDALKEVFEKCPSKALVLFGPHRRIPVPAKEAYAQPESQAVSS